MYLYGFILYTSRFALTHYFNAIDPFGIWCQIESMGVRFITIRENNESIETLMGYNLLVDADKHKILATPYEQIVGLLQIIPCRVGDATDLYLWIK